MRRWTLWVWGGREWIGCGIGVLLDGDGVGLSQGWDLSRS